MLKNSAKEGNGDEKEEPHVNVIIEVRWLGLIGWDGSEENRKMTARSLA